MTVVIADNNSKDKFLVLTKGAFDRIIPDDPQASMVHNQFADKALRVLALSYKRISEIPQNLEDIEENQTFLGIIGMIDPPRPESEQAVKDARHAGIKPLMITGDHALTAKAIAQELDIYREGDLVVDGVSLSGMTEEILDQQLEKN
ncbi:HAD family hydrolase [Lactococcus fujiensis]|uniref:HAD family hydrolase n=1 Tax=Lactococcus fujiensis TaxID=610251 RepID=UPI000AFB159C|nr:HAD family hydrolase [Lactococcus fujiensis]